MKPGYRLAVRLVAWALRHGVTTAQAIDSIDRAFPWRDETWCCELLDRAIARNAERMLSA